ncbi:hypothetical protein MKW94_028892 [Papaver nudicaule]|uniref:Uncharacterized protein n=1 Tax=Papaver nudicaule TaxID=74823 RepID=A0AA41VIH0_PAPNU|nr:hypothetical protein [Papaver nudicaule]
MYDINKQHPHLTFWCGTAMMTAYAWLVCVNHTYEHMLLWFVGFARRMGLDKVMTRRVLMSVTALMTLVVIEVQISSLLWWLHMTMIHLVSQKGSVFVSSHQETGTLDLSSLFFNKYYNRL